MGKIRRARHRRSNFVPILRAGPRETRKRPAFRRVSRLKSNVAEGPSDQEPEGRPGRVRRRSQNSRALLADRRSDGVQQDRSSCADRAGACEHRSLRDAALVLHPGRRSDAATQSLRDPSSHKSAAIREDGGSVDARANRSRRSRPDRAALRRGPFWCRRLCALPCISCFMPGSMFEGNARSSLAIRPPSKPTRWALVMRYSRSFLITVVPPGRGDDALLLLQAIVLEEVEIGRAAASAGHSAG